MKLLVSAIRTLFYDWDVSSLYADIINHTNSFIKRDFLELASWIERSFTKGELRCLNEYVKQKCQCGDNPKWHHMLTLLHIFATRCLKNNAGSPIVIFDTLQEWRKLTLLLGEDLLTTAFLATNHKSGYNASVTFDWPNIIPHNHSNINAELNQGLCDTHAHLKASADIFELTWIDFMNRLINRDEDYRKVLYMADVQIQYRRDLQNIEFRKMVQMAAILRLHIFETLNGKETAMSNTTILKILNDDIYRTKYLVEIESRIRSYQTPDNKIFNITHEYAILRKPSSNIYAIHSGERELLYKFFCRYFKNDPQVVKLADLFFLYISLKIRVRKEFVQTNPLFGFDNFKIYESRKTKFCSDDFKKIFPLYAIQSSIQLNTADKMEARVTPIEIPEQDVRMSIDGSTIRYDIDDNNLTYIIHFIKQSEDFVHRKYYGSRYSYGEKYRKEIDNILNDTRRRYDAKQYHNAIVSSRPIYKIVGIDAAGAEINCSPAVFGQTYRYARLKGTTNLTYHVGEDFYDLCDGLKAIDDAIRFLHLDVGSRLGHAIALGISPQKYYERREYQTIMSRQRLLDTLAWIYGTVTTNGLQMSVEFLNELKYEISRLYRLIGYRNPYNIDTYYMSMMLRSDSLDSEDRYSCWRRAAKCLDSHCAKARENKNAIALCHEFLTSKEVWEEGNVVEIYTYLPEIVEIAHTLQLHLRCIVLDKGITIETNPSSNVVIGPIDGYGTHTIHQFINDGIVASINTDDKGIFSTSLHNEYSLYAYSAKLMGVSDTEIIKNIKEIRTNAENSRFLPQKPTL